MYNLYIARQNYSSCSLGPLAAAYLAHQSLSILRGPTIPIWQEK